MSENIFRKAVADSIRDAVEGFDESLIEVPPDSKLGDYAFPCFTLSKAFRKAPNAIAQELAAKIKPAKLIAKVESNGPYLNFFLDQAQVAKKTLSDIRAQKQAYGRGKAAATVMVEFSSPNTNKPLHLGHLRNICIGESVSRISESAGNKVVRTCLVNNRGIHICKSMLMYQKLGKDMEPDKKSDHFVGDFYVRFNEGLKKDPKLEEEAQEMLRKWEAGDKETVRLWEKMNRWANDGFNETYDTLGIRFDKFYYESDIYTKGKDIVMKGFKEGRFAEEDKAIVADLSPLPKKVLIRSDGTSIYMTQDIYLAKLKFDEYDLDRSIYVVGSEQNLHFQQLFRILEILGFDFAAKCLHLSYGMVYLPSGKMKSREGTVVDADDIVAELKELAMKEIKKRYDLGRDEEVDRAAKIALGALKFFLLKMDPAKDMTFDPEESIAFEGETGPYVQYTYARASSILRKYGKDVDADADFSVFGEKEMDIIRHLASYSDIASDASAKPSTVCRYLLDLGQMFNEYYHSTPVLKAEEDEMKARLLLVASVREVLKSGLNLLGIDVLEEM